MFTETLFKTAKMTTQKSMYTMEYYSRTKNKPRIQVTWMSCKIMLTEKSQAKKD